MNELVLEPRFFSLGGTIMLIRIVMIQVLRVNCGQYEVAMAKGMRCPRQTGDVKFTGRT
jgi:hypothetical protein